MKSDGRVVAVRGSLFETVGPPSRVGDLLYVGGVPAEVVGFDGERVFSTALGEPRGIGPDSPVQATGQPLLVPVGAGLRGRVVDGLGAPLDGLGPIQAQAFYPLHRAAPDFSHRPRVERPLAVGLRVVDSLLTLGAGQRMALLTEPGVGTRTTLAMMARYCAAQTVVLCLLGGTATDLRDFLERDLDTGLSRCVVVAANLDSSAAARVKSFYTATAIAEYFRDQGEDVLLVVDSVTRWLARAQQADLGCLLARAGTAALGSISALYVADLAAQEPLRGQLEGQLVLTRRVAHKGHYPAVDVLQSVSRRFTEITSRQHQAGAAWLRSLLACYQENEILIENGAYKPGFHARVDWLLAHYDKCRSFLSQDVFEKADFESTMHRLLELKS